MPVVLTGVGALLVMYVIWSSIGGGWVVDFVASVLGVIGVVLLAGRGVRDSATCWRGQGKTMGGILALVLR